MLILFRMPRAFQNFMFCSSRFACIQINSYCRALYVCSYISVMCRAAAYM